MKTRLLILMMAVALFTNVRAQETWYNIDFSSSEWLTAFTDATGTDPTTLGNNSFINVLPADGNPGTSVTVNEEVFLFDGNFFRDATSDVYCFRLRNTGTFGLIQLPEVPNASKVTLNVTNGNGTNASNVTINVKKVSDESITPVVLEMPGGTTKQDLVFDIDINEPVILSIVGGSTFCKVYSIVVEAVNNTGISTPSFKQEQKPVKTQYFTIDGRETAAPGLGLYLVKKTFNDNSVKTEKLFVK